MSNQKQGQTSQQGKMEQLQRRMNTARREFKKNYQKLHQVDASHPHLFHYFQHQAMHQLNNPKRNLKNTHPVANYVTQLPNNNKQQNPKQRKINASANPVAVKVHIPIYAQHYVHQHNKYTLKSMKSARKMIKYQRAIQRERQREERQQRKAECKQKQQFRQQHKSKGMRHNKSKDYLNELMGKANDFQHKHVNYYNHNISKFHPHKHQLQKSQHASHKQLHIARHRDNPQI